MSDRLCVVMPVYNEEEAIAGVLKKWSDTLCKLGVDFMIRPYNDGSKDSSLKVMRDFVAANPNAHIEVRDKPNGGHGNTILTGYRETAKDGFDWVFQIDSDDEMGPEKFSELWTRRENYDFLVGIRDGRIQALPRKIISFVSRCCVKLFYGRRTIWDVNTPYRLMRVSAFAQIFDSIPLTTFAPNVIISGMVARKGLRFFETRVPQHDRTTGEVSIKKWKLLKAAAKSFVQTITYSLTFRMLAWACVVVTLCKIALAAIAGPVSDTLNFMKAADTVLNGQWPWHSWCYNYGPLWAGVEVFLKVCFGHFAHVAVALVIAAADVAIAMLMWKSRYRVVAFLFLLAPIGIYISGVNRMFDNLAIAVALLGLVLYGDENADRTTRRTMLMSIFLGISIMLKHVCLFLPFWLFWHEKSWRNRIIVLLVPLAIFAIGFAIPIGYEVFVCKGFSYSVAAVQELLSTHQEFKAWLCDAFPTTGAIYLTVFTYYSYGHSYFWDYIAPALCLNILPAKTWFVVAMMSLSVLGKRLSLLNLFAFYLLALFAFSPGFNCYYWAIPLLGISCASWEWYLVYNLLSFIVVWYRFPDPFGHLPRIQCPHGFGSVSQLLSVGLVFLLFLDFLRGIDAKSNKRLPFND